MISHNLTHTLLFSPINEGADTLLILSGYATPSMATWLLTNLRERKLGPINIRLIIGMASYDGLSISAHEEFKQLHGKTYGEDFSSLRCSYNYGTPSHANLFVWLKGSVPVKAFTGSACFMQSSLLSGRCELAEICDPKEALDFFDKAEATSIYCDNLEVEDQILLRKDHYVLDEEGNLSPILTGEGITHATLSLLSRDGEVGKKSGLNWGQRTRRDKNQAYIPLPSSVAKSGFFPLDKQHFTARTDDGHTLVLRVEQQGNKAITTPLSNALLGEYFRNRLALSNGAFIQKKDLLAYGRTDVTFYKIDDEEFYMDFSVHGTV